MSRLRAMLQALASLDDTSLITVITETLQRRPELAPGVVNGAVPELTYAPAEALTKRRATGRLMQVHPTGVGFIDCPELKACCQGRLEALKPTNLGPLASVSRPCGMSLMPAGRVWQRRLRAQEPGAVACSV